MDFTSPRLRLFPFPITVSIISKPVTNILQYIMAHQFSNVVLVFEGRLFFLSLNKFIFSLEDNEMSDNSNVFSF